MTDPSQSERDLCLPAGRMGHFSFSYRHEGRLYEESSPALCLGWCTGASYIPDWAKDLSELPECVVEPLLPNMLLAFDHQFGGYSCLQTSFVGLLFPLAINHHHLASTAEFERVCELLGHGMPDRAVSRELDKVHEVLGESWLTSGQTFDAKMTAGWNELLSRWLPSFPPLSWGCEAALRLGPLDPKRYTGFHALSVQADPHAIQRITTAIFTAEHVAQLLKVSGQLGVGEPCTWLLWDNSD